MKLLALVRVGKELWNLKATPDHRDISGGSLFLLPLRVPSLKSRGLASNIRFELLRDRIQGPLKSTSLK